MIICNILEITFGSPRGIISFSCEFLITEFFFTESPVTQNINGVPILVNASEVHKSQEIISLLKHTHNLNVHVQSKFEGAGFLLSSRYSIDSILISSLHPLTEL